MQNKLNTLDFILIEILLSFFIGSVPILIAYWTNPNLDVVYQLAAPKFTDPVVLYAVFLFFVHCVAWMLNKFLLKRNDFWVNATRRFHFLTHQIGFTLLTLYRVLVGVIPAALVILICQHGFADGIEKASIAGMVMVVASMYMCVSLSKFKEKSKP